MDLPPFLTGDLGGPSRHQHLSSSESVVHTSHNIELVSPTHETSKQARLCLDFIIVGGGSSHASYTMSLTTNTTTSGISGLATAYALAVSGHRVQVFEQACSLSYQPGGVHLPPNATRILTHWGIGEELIAKAATTKSSSIIDCEYHDPQQLLPVGHIDHE